MSTSITHLTEKARKAVRKAEAFECGEARKLAAETLREVRRRLGRPKNGLLRLGAEGPQNRVALESILTNVRLVKRECPIRRRR